MIFVLKLWCLKVLALLGDLIRLRNCYNSVEGILFAIFDLLLGSKTITLHLYGVWGDDFQKKPQF